MEVTEFFRCRGCSRWVEMVEFLKKQKASCVCGSKHFVPTILNKWEVFCYIVTHPRCLWDTYVRKN